jgi:hypothetical protein
MVLKEALLYMIQGFMGGPPTDLKNMVNFRSEKSGICGVKDIIQKPEKLNTLFFFITNKRSGAIDFWKS